MVEAVDNVENPVEKEEIGLIYVDKWEDKLKKNIEQLIYKTASENNTLSLGSACNMSCTFCSHQFNPPGIEVFHQAWLSLEQIENLLDFMTAEKKIIIGESATRIIEGEPFLHPHFREIIEKLRERFPQTTIQLTTNGSRLTEEMIAFLQQNQPIELNFSLNSSSCEGRRSLMQDKRPEVALTALTLLSKAGISFHGSIVAMPQVVGWSDLEETIRALADKGALTVRIFLPGFSDYNIPSWSFDKSLRLEVQELLTRLRRELATPLLFEPPYLQDLQANIQGIMQGSPASKTDLQQGDVILEIAGSPPLSRADAFEKIKNLANPGLKIVRNGKEYIRTVFKEKNQASGLVFDYDMDYWTLNEWQKSKYERALICASSLACPCLQAAVRLLAKKWEVIEVPNRFFGGSIACAGLLTVADYSAAIKAYLAEGIQPEIIFISQRSFDCWGRDLKGQSYLELEELYDIEIKLS